MHTAAVASHRFGRGVDGILVGAAILAAVVTVTLIVRLPLAPPSAPVLDAGDVAAELGVTPTRTEDGTAQPSSPPPEPPARSAAAPPADAAPFPRVVALQDGRLRPGWSDWSWPPTTETRPVVALEGRSGLLVPLPGDGGVAGFSARAETPLRPPPTARVRLEIYVNGPDTTIGLCTETTDTGPRSRWVNVSVPRGRWFTVSVPVPDFGATTGAVKRITMVDSAGTGNEVLVSQVSVG